MTLARPNLPLLAALTVAAWGSAALANGGPHLLFGVSYVNPDSGRDAKYGAGGSAGLAYPLAGSLWLEGRVFANVLEADEPDTGSFSQEGLGLDLLVPLGEEQRGHLFVLAGGGAVRNDGAPGTSGDTSAFVNAAAGWRSAAAPGALRYRIELRASNDRYDGGQTDVLLGLVVELGGAATRADTPAAAPRKLVRIERPAPVPAALPPADADGDGVPDEDDRCADTLAGAKVESDGCVWQDQIVTVTGIRFPSGLAKLSEDSHAKLDAIAAFFASQPDVTMDVYGHTDAQGDAGYNQTLSTSRAEAVRIYLVTKGIASRRVQAHGFGETRPVDSNDTEAGRARNRRVELHIHARQPD